MVLISVVLPVYNEKENLDILISRLISVLSKATKDSYEVLFVDDGSCDGSAEMLDQFHANNEQIKVIHFSRNFGHQAALQAGLDRASGAAVVLMDADLQDPPELIEDFIQRWREGYEVVYAVRDNRKEGRVKVAAYSVFYRTMRAIAQIEVPLNAGDFCLLDRSVVNTLNSLKERNRFLRGLRSWVGYNQVGVKYDRDARHAGEPKYTFRKLLGLAFSGYFGFSAIPLHLAAWLGLSSAVIGFLLMLWVIVTKLMTIPSPRGWASIAALILFVGGIQLLILGIMGDYLGRVYDEVRQRPLYIVSSKLGFSNDGLPLRCEEASDNDPLKR